jgi:hypothetical protein
VQQPSERLAGLTRQGSASALSDTEVTMSPGPAPKPSSVRARRNNPKAGFRILNPKGRNAAAPPWPLQPSPRAQAALEFNRDRVASLQVEIADAEDGRTKGRLRRGLSKAEMLVTQLELEIDQARDAEVALWADLWGMPQAVIWEESHALREVAQYVRWKIAAEQGDLKAATEARMLSDRLGLNPLALLRLRAEIEHVQAAEAQGDQRRGAVPTTQSAKRKKGDDPRNGLFAVG